MAQQQFMVKSQNFTFMKHVSAYLHSTYYLVAACILTSSLICEESGQEKRPDTAFRTCKKSSNLLSLPTLSMVLL